MFSYNAHVHRTMQPNGVGPFTLSYNVNSMDSRVDATADHYKDPGIYKPRFVSFSMVPGSAARQLPLQPESAVLGQGSAGLNTWSGLPGRFGLSGHLGFPGLN
ncbi:hypothetical protein [Streptomyces cyaneofuscatus]|uniref:hypothetical protein n=1 Tax=Streptomyces cyaneofuscatus TaxID=66883 RepID=UPI0033B4D42D